jgi:hypothetical protein
MPGLDGPAGRVQRPQRQDEVGQHATSPDPSPPGGSGMPLTQLQTVHGKG